MISPEWGKTTPLKENTMRKTLALALLALASGVSAMTHNLAWPWGDGCSPPQSPYLSFYSHQSDDMMFKRGRTIRITCQAGLRSLGLSWSLHRNAVNKPFLSGEAEALPANKFYLEIPTKDLIPGFYDIRVTLDTGLAVKDRDRLKKRPVTGVCTFGWKAGKMAIRDSRPADFKQFWAKAKREIDAVPLDVRYETPMQTYTGKQIDEYNLKSACLPGDYDPSGHKVEEVESCKVSFAGPDGGRVYGWLAKPKGDGPFPVMLVLPGAGFNARPRPLEHARHGYLALDIQIHGQDVDLEGKYPRLPGYYEEVVHEPIDKYYFYNIHKRVMQAVNYLMSRPDADASRVVAVGGSQGGRLGIVIAGLDPRITAVVSTIANSPNHPHRYWLARCNGFQKPGDRSWTIKYKRTPLQDGMDLKGAPPAVDTPDAACFAYYDPMNYAPDITCPVLMLGGLIDPVSPPYSVWAVFNRLESKAKEIFPIPGHGHDWSAAFDRHAWKWLEKTR
jgi:cephalosporin-C deacetylase-like acetyl esterase